MGRRSTTILLECIADLGVTVVYATLVGGLIAAVETSDGGSTSWPWLIAYAGLLPASVIALIGLEAALRVVGDRRASARHIAAARPTPPHSPWRRSGTVLD